MKKKWHVSVDVKYFYSGENTYIGFVAATKAAVMRKAWQYIRENNLQDYMNRFNSTVENFYRTTDIAIHIYVK